MPPVEAQAPMLIDHLGWGIWSQIRRMTGASLNGSRPAQISTSACRGEKLIRSIPKRARSNRLAAVAMNSMAQQGVPKGIGQREVDGGQLVRKSSFVVTKLGKTAETVVVSSPWFWVAGLINPFARLPPSRGTRTPTRG